MYAAAVPRRNGLEAMYFGSVKFFKHLIYTVFFGWLALATFFSIFFGVRYFLEVKENNAAGKNNEETINISKDTTVEDLYLHMIAMGYSEDEIMDIIRSSDEEAFESYIKSYIENNPDIVGEADSIVEAYAPVLDSHASYTKLYPDLYVDDPTTGFEDDDGTIYLTFDDGPSSNTWDILRILKDYDIKATFFFCGGWGDSQQELMKAVADAGHTIGIHSISHDYEKIYESVESYLEDFYDTYQCVYEATGIKPKYFRFPGGSINNYNRFVYMQIIAEMTRRGFVYYDWNVSGEDAVHGATWSSIYENILTGINNNTSDRAIVLLHDAADKHNTVYVLEDVIDKLLDDGYHFGQINDSVRPVAFGYVD